MRIPFVTLFIILLVSVLYSNRLQPVQVAAFDEKMLILYDGASGQIPNSSLMGFADFPLDGASVTYSDGATVLDTTVSSNDTFAGWVSSQSTTAGFPTFDSTVDIQVNFMLQVESERHGNQNRAGFSVIILDQRAKGIEIAFWEDEIWVQSDDQSGGLFRHGESATFATTDMAEYQLMIAGDTYTLLANSEPLLTGPVRDYSNFSGFPDPYETANFLFLGDDTTSCQSRVKLKFLSVTGSEPVIPTAAATITSAAISVETPSPIPLPSATSVPFPTPAPAQPGIELCPSGWLFGTVVIANVIMIRKNKRRRAKHI